MVFDAICFNPSAEVAVAKPILPKTETILTFTEAVSR